MIKHYTGHAMVKYIQFWIYRPALEDSNEGNRQQGETCNQERAE